MANVVDQSKKFVIEANVKGALISSFCFESQEEFDAWKKSDFIELQQKYGPLTLSEGKLPGLSVGDTCCVYGEGMEEFKIVELIEYSKNRFGFVLDSGWSEEVVKCFVRD